MASLYGDSVVRSSDGDLLVAFSLGNSVFVSSDGDARDVSSDGNSLVSSGGDSLKGW